MNWEQTRIAYLEKLEKATALLDRCSALCSKTPKEVLPDSRKALEQLRVLAARQEEKLKANRFELAVLGLEKAGKSTLLNAWLGAEILPAMDERCTYTACEIWSAPGEEAQEYRIEYYAPAEFEQRMAQKREAADALPQGIRERAELETEIQESEAMASQIQAFLGRGEERRNFRDVDEVRSELREAIALDRARARAIRRIVLKTVNLRADRDIVFYDVPGFNSPVEFHRQLADEKLKRCDAILYAKEHDKPDLVDREIEMLGVADAADPHVRVSGKIFIALTRIDKAESKERFAHRTQKAREKWADVPPDRIVGVSPPARLYRLGGASPELMRDGRKIQADLAALGADDGMDPLKAAVNRYIDTDRARALEKRCQGILNDTVRAVSGLVGTLETAYPQPLGDMAFAEEDARFNALIQWWEAQWPLIQEEFSAYYTTRILPKEDADAPAREHEKLAEFTTAFSRLAETFIESLSLSDAEFESRYRTLGLTEEGIVDPQRAHIRLREELHQRALQGLAEISADLAKTLEEIMNEIGDWVVERLWGVEKLKSELLESSQQLHRRLEHGMSTLFLRFARPAVHLFLLSPRGFREQYLRAYHSDRVVLSEFYRGPDREQKRHLENYLRTGRWEDEATAEAAPKPKPSDTAPDYFPPALRDTPKGFSANLTDIQAEIREDSQALQDYLIHSVFHAAGFIKYCRQELDRIKWTFLSHKTRWQQHVAAAYRRKHPPLMAEERLNRVQDFEFLRGVVAELSAVREKLADLKGLIGH